MVDEYERDIKILKKKAEEEKEIFYQFESDCDKQNEDFKAFSEEIRKLKSENQTLKKGVNQMEKEIKLKTNLI